MVRYFTPALTRLGVLTAHPAAFFVLACYVGAWLVFNPKSFDWQSVATVATTWATPPSSVPELTGLASPLRGRSGRRDWRRGHRLHGWPSSMPRRLGVMIFSLLWFQEKAPGSLADSGRKAGGLQSHKIKASGFFRTELRKKKFGEAAEVQGVMSASSRGLRSGGESNTGNPDGERVTVPEDAVSIRLDRPTKSSSI